MTDFSGLMKDYYVWKNKVLKTLNEDYDSIAGAIVSAYGLNYFVEIEARERKLVVGNPCRIGDHKFVVKGVVVTHNESSNEYLIWFFRDGVFYLVAKQGWNNLEYLVPEWTNYENGIRAQDCRRLWAKEENKIEFLLAFVNFEESLMKKLEEKMKSNTLEGIALSVDRVKNYS